MIYKFKVTIEGNKNFAREYEIDADSTLYDFHRFIQSDLYFDEAQLAVFFTVNQKWERTRAIPLFDMGSGAMDSVVLSDLIAAGNTQLLYVFDMYNNRQLKIEFEGEEEELRRASYPRTITSKGNAPGQFSKSDNNSNDLDINGDDNESIDSDDLGDLSETDDV